MTHEQFEVLSNQAVAACGVAYFLAFLAHLGQWAAARRSAPAEAEVAQHATASVGGGTSVAERPVAAATVPDEPERMQLLGRVGVALTVVAAAVHALAVVTRGLAADPVRVPWGNMYEFTLTGTFFVVLGYLLLYKRFGLSWLSPVVTGFVLVVLMVDVLALYEEVVPLQDSLQSPWLVIHVVAAVIATAAFTIGGMCSVLYLVKSRWEQRTDAAGRARGGYLARLPELAVLDRVAYRTHAFGFPIWTFAALITGPIWAHYAWGRYWGWDPKEVWAFITWVVYAAYLHARATSGWKGSSAAVVALVGLATLWFNFVGINFFFGSGSQHSYAAPEPTAVVLRLDG
ncbi:c-type cytochrome biogenesis protein CcsB [Nocardioides aurantiacus]|uniref:Cytochrome c-type biogenesis protein CcsB n=1 Tax=Nocardioides aurantiacus TaxID=86796 RepID=A0A3N2CPQ2_9ACTN|nr:c-type cytochrome biogenesis protein CcsB [Nocardioides aurantiacus]ROR89500.1 cytochrome c-type biogenesis protein CcsB [Nocardioides aurantiacus]